jgi:hypothetical protein
MLMEAVASDQRELEGRIKAMLEGVGLAYMRSIRCFVPFLSIVHRAPQYRTRTAPTQLPSTLLADLTSAFFSTSTLRFTLVSHFAS